MLRHPAVAGYFYEGMADALRSQVRGCIVPEAAKRRAIGVMAPHAGLIYSGAVAGAVYSGIDLPGIIVLIGPNHTGLGAPVSLMAKGEWETPLGSVAIDEPLAASILARSARIRDDSLAHLREHSLEVQLPFIQFFKDHFKIVPIQMLDTRLETCIAVGKAVGEAILERSRQSKDEDKGSGAGSREKLAPEPRTLHPDVLIVASSDMTHYEKASAAKEKDHKAIHHILALDPEGLYQTVRDYGITMCGYGPAVAMLVAAKILGASKAELIKYANSGDASGDYEQVVGYAGIVVR